MGGLRKKIPWTFWTMTAGTFAIAGFPPLSGFFSKDHILWKAWSSPHGSWVYWAVALLTAFLTSFYMFRLWFMTFFGEQAQPEAAVAHEPHESPWIMLAPLVLLAVLSVVGGWIGIPHALGGQNQFDAFLAPVIQPTPEQMPAGGEPGHPGAPLSPEDLEREKRMERLLTGVSVGAAALGLALAALLYWKRRDLPGKITAALGGVYTTVRDKYYVDEGYRAAFVQPLLDASTYVLWRGIDVRTIDAAVDGAADGSRHVSDALRRMQSGNIRSYAGWVAAGAAVLLAYMIWAGAR